MKVEIDFFKDIETNSIIPNPLGRLMLGGHIGRLCLSPEGKMIMFISRDSINDGSIILVDDFCIETQRIMP